MDDRVELTLLARRLTVELEAFSHGFATLHDLHPTDVRAIVLIMDAARRGRALRPAELSRDLELSTASITALLDRLERHGHVERHRHPTDRRGVTIRPGAEIMRLGGAYFGGLQQRLVDALAGFSDDDVRAARRVVESMIDVVSRREP
jgi:DNA-binding MarR family transcriptional regulator